MSDLVLLSIADRVATVTLNRPHQLNAFAEDMRERLLARLDEAAARDDVRVLVITGAGRAFCSGGDVRAMAALRERRAAFAEMEPLLDAGRAIVTRLAALPFPTVAAVNGVAAGAGMNLALACDLRVASSAASFGETFARIGLHADWGGTFALPRLVGVARALELCWLADVIDAGEALRIGLVNRVVPEARFAEEVAAWAARLAAAPRVSVAVAKLTLRAAPGRSLGQCLDAESEAQRACWESADVDEGMRAFVEKRAAKFGDRGVATAGARPWAFE